MGRYTAGGVGRDIIVGALAGMAANWVADKLDRAIQHRAGAESRRRTAAARPDGMDPAHVVAKRAADAVGADVGDARDNPLGHTVHYGSAAGIGALYGLLRGMSPGIGAGRGSFFGIAMFVFQDRIGNTVMGTAGNPLNTPVRDHARDAATYTLFGIMTDLGTRLLSPWRDQVVIEQGPPLSERLDKGRQYLEQQRNEIYGQSRHYLEQGRAYLDESIAYAAERADQARRRLPEVNVEAMARRGRHHAGQVAGMVRSQIPNI